MKLTPQEIETTRHKVVMESHNLANSIAFLDELVEAGAQAHADKLSKLTEGELREALLFELLKVMPCTKMLNEDCPNPEAKCTNCPEIKRYTENIVIPAILSLISPQLLKKNEEIERLNKVITELRTENEFALKTKDEVSQAVQQAKQDERERIEIQHIDAINDYVKGKISFERCAEILDINFYELAEFCTVRRQALQGER